MPTNLPNSPPEANVVVTPSTTVPAIVNHVTGSSQAAKLITTIESLYVVCMCDYSLHILKSITFQCLFLPLLRGNISTSVSVPSPPRIENPHPITNPVEFAMNE